MSDHAPQDHHTSARRKAADTVVVLAIPRHLSRQVVVFLHAVAFVLGFSLVFIVGWGGAATLLGQLFSDYKDAISKIGGVVVILFGLHTLGVHRFAWLNLAPQFLIQSPAPAYCKLCQKVRTFHPP